MDVRETDHLAAAIDSFLRSIPERWADFDHDALSSTEQQGLFLLVAAGLVERRIRVRGEFAGKAPVVEFAIEATGEYGLLEAMEPIAAEMWTKWGPAFEAWRASDAKGSTPFRFTKTGLDRWRLTDQGVIARSDLDIQAPSPGTAAFVGSHQRAIEFITRTGHQTDRQGVRGEGRLVEMSATEPAGSESSPIPVSLTNAEELAAAFRDALIPGLAEALRVKPCSGMPIEEVIAKAEAHVKAHRGVFPGRNKLAKIVGCSTSQMSKAIDRSPYLKARKAEHEAGKRGTSPERQSSQPLEGLAYDHDWRAAEAERDATLDKLIGEQKADQMREEAQRTRARRQRLDD